MANKITDDDLDMLFASKPPETNNKPIKLENKIKPEDNKLNKVLVEKDNKAPENKANKKLDNKTNKELDNKQVKGDKKVVELNNNDSLVNQEDDEFFDLPVKSKFNERYTQANVWLKNEILDDLNTIFKNTPKGFKTEFYNNALAFYIKNYKQRLNKK